VINEGGFESPTPLILISKNFLLLLYQLIFPEGDNNYLRETRVKKNEGKRIFGKPRGAYVAI
jgi:hypothetical protein